MYCRVICRFCFGINGLTEKNILKACRSSYLLDNFLVRQSLTYLLHGTEIKNINFDKINEKIICTIEDFYNFNPNRTSVKGRIGYKLQKQGDLKPFYVIINIEIPKTIWDKYKI